MDLNEIIEEMRRKPDAQYLIEWIYNVATELGDAKAAIDAYFDGVEDA
jgi:hypothetical protein